MGLDIRMKSLKCVSPFVTTERKKESKRAFNDIVSMLWVANGNIAVHHKHKFYRIFTRTQHNPIQNDFGFSSLFLL